MHMYQGLIIEQENGKYLAVILKLSHDNEPNCDTLMEHESVSEDEANIWLDDEMSRITTGKGVWE